MDEPKNPKLYETVEYETDEGMYTTFPMERLVRQAAALAPTGAEQICPKCDQWGVLFFGDSEGDHWCVTCQIISDFDLEPDVST